MRRYVQTTFGEVELHLYHRRERALRLARRLGASVTFVENAHAQTNGFDSGDDRLCSTWSTGAEARRPPTVPRLIWLGKRGTMSL